MQLISVGAYKAFHFPYSYIDKQYTGHKTFPMQESWRKTPKLHCTGHQTLPIFNPGSHACETGAVIVSVDSTVSIDNYCSNCTSIQPGVTPTPLSCMYNYYFAQVRVKKAGRLAGYSYNI